MRPDKTDRTNLTGSGLCTSLSHGADGEKFCLQNGVPHPPSSTADPCPQPDLKPAGSPTVSNRERVRASPAFLSHSFTRQVTVRDLDIWIHVKMCLLVSNQGFTSMLFSAKELKNHVIYTYTSVCIEKCLYKWGRWPAYTLGTPRSRDATGQTGCVPLSLRCQAPTSQVENQMHTRTDSSWRAAPARSSSSHSCQLRPTARMWGRGEERKEGKGPDCGTQEYQNKPGEEGYVHMYRLHKDQDEGMVGTRLEARAQHALFSLQQR